jgi:hypothetical protein
MYSMVPAPAVVNRLGGQHRIAAHGFAHGGADDGRRGFFDHLLAAALGRAVALADVDGVAVAVGEDLDLDVAAVEDQALEHQRAVAEGALRFTAGADDGLGQLVVLVDQAHAAPAAAADGLDQQRVAQALAFGHQDLVVLVVAPR